MKDYALAAALAGAAILISVFGILLADANRNLIDKQQAQITDLQEALVRTNIQLITIQQGADRE